MLDDEGGNPAGKQLMVLWSTKDNPLLKSMATHGNRLEDLVLMRMGA